MTSPRPHNALRQAHRCPARSRHWRRRDTANSRHATFRATGRAGRGHSQSNQRIDSLLALSDEDRALQRNCLDNFREPIQNTAYLPEGPNPAPVPSGRRWPESPLESSARPGTTALQPRPCSRKSATIVFPLTHHWRSRSSAEDLASHENSPCNRSDRPPRSCELRNRQGRPRSSLTLSERSLGLCPGPGTCTWSPQTSPPSARAICSQRQHVQPPPSEARSVTEPLNFRIIWSFVVHPRSLCSLSSAPLASHWQGASKSSDAR